MLCRASIVIIITLVSLVSVYKQVYSNKEMDPNTGGNMSHWGQNTKNGEVVNGFRDVILISAEGLNKWFIANTEYRN